MDKVKVALVTGASGGIGESIARELAYYGFKVYGAARRVCNMEHLREYGIIPVTLDLTKEDSIKACVDEIILKEGRVDVLVNNAGYGSYGAIEDVPLEEARRQFDVNLFGMAGLVQCIVPCMRKNHYGKIVNISSMGGKIWTKFGGWYHATKFAVEGFSDCLRLELKPFGIDVIVVEPGGIKTDWGIIAAENLKRTSMGGAYEKEAEKAANGMVGNYTGKMLSSPAVIGRTVRKAVMKRHPKTRYCRGFMGRPMILMHKLFGDRFYDWMIRNFS